MTDDLEPLSPQEGIESFLRHREVSVRQSTLYNSKTRLNFFRAWCAEREIENLNELTGRDLADFVSWRQRDVKPITLQKQVSTIRMFLRWAADIEAVTEGLAEKVHAPELPDGSEAKDVHITQEHADELLRYLMRYHRGAETTSCSRFSGERACDEVRSVRST
ncbi:site-specific integrase [Haloarculaceae archaeon H-GB2-1]|nr:site-specific integrase [Haloarculaceae archaeon H-GB2-1]